MKLKKWTKIKDRFTQNLLLGNGASIAIDERLSYKSLYEQVCEVGKLNKDLQGLFDSFDTTNFEFILKLLLQTSRVNEALGIEDKKTSKYYRQLRDTLIKTIREIHPTYPDVEHFLKPIANFMMNFKTVLSLNYDLIIYWSMLLANETLRCTWFKDCFKEDGAFEKDFGFYYQPLPPAKGATLIFYPHGSLSLAIDQSGDEVKLSRSKEVYLLDRILKKWEAQDYIPLFVSEGESKEKFRAITRSSYLNAVYDSVLSRVSGSLVIYGWSASEHDNHIFNALDHKGVTDIAVSVYTQDPDWESYCEGIEDRIASARHIRNANVEFFDAENSECWIY